MKENPTQCDLYCHDSLHTMKHMMKELLQFKKCQLDNFFIYIDDQNTDNFWQIVSSMKGFGKLGYNTEKIDGSESRLKAHLGGFIQYTKETQNG